MELFWQVLFICLAMANCQNNNCRYSTYIPTNGNEYFIYNDEYPNNYRNPTECYWYFYTDPGYKVQVQCNLRFPLSNGYCTDTMNTLGSSRDGAYCGNFRVESLDHRLMVFLRPNYSTQGGTFLCTIKVNPKEQCRCGWSFRTRVVGGQNAKVHEFPMMVSLVDIRKRAHACGATIISQNYVLTAAHCLDVLLPTLTGVLVGEHNFSTGVETNATKLYRVKRFISHPGWSKITAGNDIGLIEVNGPIEFSNSVGPACLPFARSNQYNNGQLLTVLGWGTTSFGGPVSEVLQKALLNVVPIENCQKTFNYNKVNSREQICTYTPGKDSCQMDSGGPLLTYNNDVSSWFLAGLVSYGAVCAGEDPSVSTRVAGYLDWIKTTTGENFCVL